MIDVSEKTQTSLSVSNSAMSTVSALSPLNFLVHRLILVEYC